MTGDLAGRSVIVTGACGGIGSACARLFAGRGARLTLVDRNRDRLAELSGSLGAAEVQELAST